MANSKYGKLTFKTDGHHLAPEDTFKGIVLVLYNKNSLKPNKTSTRNILELQRFMDTDEHS